MSTLGFLSAPLAFDFVRSWRAQLPDLDWQQANALLDAMEAEGRTLLASSGVAPGAISHRREADMRYVGQGHEIRVPLPAAMLDASQAGALHTAFETVYRELYERLGPAVGVEILNWRVVSSGPQPTVALRIPSPGHVDVAQARKGERPAYFPEAGGFVTTPIYDRYRLAPGMLFGGPAIVEERESTAIIGPGARCRVDAQHNLVVELEERL
jgi:N-methylhydantoinase A